MEKIETVALSAGTVRAVFWRQTGRTKCYKRCHEECSGTDCCKMFVYCFCNTEQMLCLFNLITVFGETCFYETVKFVSFDTVINCSVVIFLSFFFYF